MHSPTPNGLPSPPDAAGNAEADTAGIQNGTQKEQPPSLEQQYNELQEAYNGLQDELKKLQEQDFNAHKKDQAEPHHVVSAQFTDVFRMSTDWARDYFRIKLDSFQLDDYALFKEHLDKVLWKDCDLAKKKQLNVSHLVQAVVAEVLARRILLTPFAGCPKSSQHEFGQMYDAILKGDRSRAHKWRATTLSAYETCGKWAPSGSSTPPQPIARWRQNYYEQIGKDIDLIVGPIAQKHFPNRGDDDERLERAMEFIKATGELAVVLGNKAAELQIMDKSWFENSQRAFVCNDDKMKGRFEEEYEQEERFRVDIILRPGFLKYGNNEGEFLDRCAVWIPATVDLTDLSSETATVSDSEETSKDSAPRNDNPIPSAAPGPQRFGIRTGQSDIIPELSGKNPAGVVSNGPSPGGIRPTPKPEIEQTTAETQALHQAQSPNGYVLVKAGRRDSEASRGFFNSFIERFPRVKKRIQKAMRGNSR